MAGDDFWLVHAAWASRVNPPLAQGPVGITSLVKSAGQPAEWVEGELGAVLLKLLASRASLESYAVSQELGRDHQQVVGAIKSIKSLGDVRNSSNPST